MCTTFPGKCCNDYLSPSYSRARIVTSKPIPHSRMGFRGPRAHLASIAMTDLGLLTPLESFLLFDSLQRTSTDTLDFNGIAASLRTNELILESESYNPNRLNPDALQHQYLLLLKKEAKQLKVNNTAGNVLENEQGAQERRSASPDIVTLDEALKYKQLLPFIVNALYFRYRDHAVQEIRDEEQRYRQLQKEIQDIERGEWDTRLVRRESAGGPSIKTLLRHDDETTPVLDHGRRESPKRHMDTPPKVSGQSLPSQLPPVSALSGVNTQLADRDRPTNSANTPSAPAHTRQEHFQHSQTSPAHSRTSSTTGSQSISNLVEPQRPELPKLPSQPSYGENNISIYQPHQLPSHVYVPPSPKPDSQRRPPPLAFQSQSSSGRSPNTRPHQIPHVLPDQPTASPIILPPPPGMLRGSGSPTGSLSHLADMAGQHQRATLPSPLQSSRSGGHSSARELPQPRNYGQRAFPYYDSQASHPTPYSPYGPTPLPPHYSHQSTMQYQGVPASQSPGYYGTPLYQHPYMAYSPQQAYNPSPSYQRAPQSLAHQHGQPPRISDYQTPTAIPSDQRRFPKPSPIQISATSTKWKTPDTRFMIRSPGSPIRPSSRDVSPVSVKAQSPVLEQENSGQTESFQHLVGNAPVPDLPRQAPNEADGGNLRNPKTRGSKQRGRASGRRMKRGGSVASSALASSAHSRTRSQSVQSHLDELSIDAIPGGNRVKPEPPATPAGNEDNEMAENTADESNRRLSRRGRGTLQSLELPESSRANNKRKRAIRETPDAAFATPSLLPPSPSPASRPNQILASRNFPRTSATVMNDITAHKLASMFAKPLTEREAPGYKSLVHRPQDLKSIQKAIMQGSKAVTAAVENQFSTPVGDVGSPAQGANASQKSTTVLLPASEDLMPPKGIVNSAQLEKEVTRIFANAVMFNPDSKHGLGPAFNLRSMDEQKENPDDRDEMPLDEEEEEGGIARDAREMFTMVERTIMGWRAAEKAAEDIGGRANLARAKEMEKDADDVDELVGEDTLVSVEAIGGGANKRRKKR